MKYKVAASILILSSQLTFAGPQCSKEQTDQWLSEEDMKSKIADMGYTFDQFKISRGKCYEIYGHNQQGSKVEVYFDPISGEIVEEEIDS